MKLWHRLTASGSIGRDSLVAMAIRAVGLALGFLSHILLSRSLGAESYGRYAIVLGSALIFVIPARMGLDTSAYKFASLYRHQGDNDRLAAFQRFSFAAMAVGTIMWAGVGVLAAVLIARHGNAEVRWAEVTAFAAMIFPLAVIGYVSVVLRTSGRIAASQIYDQILRPLLISLAILWVVWRIGALGLGQALMITVVSLWLALIAAAIHSHRAQPMTGGRSAPDDRRLWLKTGGTMLAISAIQELMNQVDVILLGWAGQPHAAALFSAASRLSTLVAFGLVAVSMIAASPIAVAHAKGDRLALRTIARQSARLSTSFAVAVAVAINVAGGRLLGLFGTEFVGATAALAILTVGYVINAMTGVVGYLLSMTGHEKSFLGLVAVSLVGNVALNLILVPTLGATGAAIAASAGISLLNILAAIVAWQRVGIDGTIFARRPA